MTSLRKKLLLTFKCARIVLWPAIFLNAGIIALCNTTASIPQAVLAALSLCCVASYGFLINDRKDIEVDRINHSNRLENANESELAFIRLASGVLLGASLVLSAGLGGKGFVCVGLISLGLTVYTFYARKKLFFATALAAILASTPLWAPSLIFDSQLTISQIGVIVATAFLLMGREILFDAADIRGDSHGKRRTFATVFNQRLALDLSIALNCFGAVLLLLLLVYRQPTSLHFIAWAGVVLFSWLILPSILKFRNSPESSVQLDILTQRSRLAMLLLPVFWLSF